jgi:hypothetical protein
MILNSSVPYSGDLKSWTVGVPYRSVKAQIWVAVCAYLLVLITIKHHRLPIFPQISLHLIETNIFEKVTLDQL